MRVPIVACLAAALLVSAAPAAANADRARQNYISLINGTRQLAELTPIEVAELLELDRQIRAEQADKRTPRQKCIDKELDRLGDEPTEFALRAIDLRCSQR